MKRVIIVGASGMVGSIVLKKCLETNEIKEVISICRKKSNIDNPKYKEIIHNNFLDFTSIDFVFKNIDVAYYCLGVYTGQISDNKFKEITVEYTKAFSNLLKEKSPNSTFCFLSGSGADSKELSKMSFAKYKGMAENYLISKKFSNLYIFRPGYIYPVNKRKEPNFMYKFSRLIYPIIKLFGKKYSIKSTELGEAIFKAGLINPTKIILENEDILNTLNKY